MAAYLSVSNYVTSSEGYRVLPGVEELLARLHEAGVLLGVTTGASRQARTQSSAARG